MASVKCVQMVKYQIRLNHTVIHYSHLNQFSLYNLQFVIQTQSETHRLMCVKLLQEVHN